MVTKGGRSGRDKLGFGIIIHTVLYTEEINNKVLLCSTWNYIHYPVSNHNGKEYEKEHAYV